ncbi:unnamed protein product, partial [Mesorhabditis belari]|uniref:Uncharacterized protein n=1 Tax=Mesorhabditis belari TaxID=2138241 RepID=A0AAF3EU54_9BILA
MKHLSVHLVNVNPRKTEAESMFCPHYRMEKASFAVEFSLFIGVSIGLTIVFQKAARFLVPYLITKAFDENYTMTKYVVQRILGGQQEHDPRGRATVASGCVSEICAAWNLDEKEKEKERRKEKIIK